MSAAIRYATPSGWNQIATPGRARSQSLGRDIRVRFAIVGAGFAGHAIARRLSELFPADEIALFDALPRGEGAAGRSSGFMLSRADSKIDVRGSAAEVRWGTAILRAGKETLRKIVDHHNISCDWRDIGHYKTASTDAGAKALDALLTSLSAKGVRGRSLSQADIVAQLGCTRYTHAIWLPDCTLVQPAELINGLLDTLPSQVGFYENTPIMRLIPGTPNRVTSERHTVQADTVIFSNNASLPFFGYGRSRQLNVYTYGALTPPLDAGELDKLGQETDWGATPAESLGPSTRKLNSGRLLFRAGFSYKSELPPAQIKDLLRTLYRQYYPAMQVHEFEHVWGGALSMSRNGMPIFGKLDKNVYGLSACNASGILKMTALGGLLAEDIAGMDSPLLRETKQFARPQWMPPEPIRRIAVHMQMARMKRAMDQRPG